MPTKDDFQAELHARFRRAEEKGASYIDIKAGDLHRKVGGYPGSKDKDHNMPGCCNVMWGEMPGDDEVIASPPSGRGASLTIRYRLPRR